MEKWHTFKRQLTVLCEDRPGLLKEFTSLISEDGTSIYSVKCTPAPKGRVRVDFVVETVDVKYLDKLKDLVGKVTGVDSVKIMGAKTIGKTLLLTNADRIFLADFRRYSKVHVDKVTKTKEAAMQELIDAGIYGSDGKLSKQYRSVA